MANARFGDRHEVVEVLRDAAATLSADLSRTARDTQAAAQELASAVRQSAVDLSQDAVVRARGATKAVRKQVRAHPAAWAAGAAGLGFLIGCLITTQREAGPFDAE